jgi:hypothetical protein
VLVVVGLSVPAALIGVPFYYRYANWTLNGVSHQGINLGAWHVDSLPEALLLVPVGVVLLFAALHLFNVFTRFSGILAPPPPSPSTPPPGPPGPGITWPASSPEVVRPAPGPGLGMQAAPAPGPVSDTDAAPPSYPTTAATPQAVAPMPRAPQPIDPMPQAPPAPQPPAPPPAAAPQVDQ